MSTNGGPITQKTLSRPPDRWPDESSGDVIALSRKFVGLYYGDTWYVHHNLSSTDLIIDVWLDSSTPSAHYSSAVQVSDTDIVIEWDSTARGKCVVFAIGTDLQDSLVHLQTVSSSTWIVNHMFGTDNLVCDVWVDGARVDPTLITIDLFNVQIDFTDPCTGKACIMVADPLRNKDIEVSFLNLRDLPPCFDPCAHVHTDPTEIPKAYDSERLGGYTPDFWIHKDDVGDTVCELDSDGLIPFNRLPKTSNIRAGDYDQELTAQRILVDSKNTPLYAKKQITSTATTIIVSSYPVVRYIRLVSDDPNSLDIPPSMDNVVRTSANWDMRLITGPGIKFRKVDGNSVQIMSSMVVPSIFKRNAPLYKGQTWSISSPEFAIPGNQIMNAYEMTSTGGAMKSQSNHILGQYDPLLVFTRSGPDLLALNDDTLETKLNQASDHFLWDELMYDSASGAVTLPMPELFSVVYDTILHDYVLIYKRVGSGIWVFYTVDVTSGVTTLVSSIPIDPDMPLVDIRYGYLYGLRGAMTGLVELVRTPLSSLPSSISWQPVATFSGVSYPGDIGQARLFHYHSNKMYLLEEGFNRLTVYDTLVPTAAASFAKVPPVPCTSFDVWADGYITFSHKSSSFMGTYTSDKPGYDPTHSYRPNVEISSGQSKFIAVGNDVTGLAVKSDGRWVTSNANVASHNLYATGSAVYWTKTPFAWDVPSTYTRVFNIAWEGLDLTGFDDVRIGFVLSSAGNTIPSTLVGWTGTSWYTFLTSNIAFDGAPLSSVATMELNGTQVVGYALYVKKSDPFKSGYIINNFLFDYQLSSIVSPIPMSFDGAHDSLKVEISPNLMKLTNVNDRDIHGLMVVVNQVP